MANGFLWANAAAPINLSKHPQVELRARVYVCVSLSSGGGCDAANVLFFYVHSLKRDEGGREEGRGGEHSKWVLASVNRSQSVLDLQ